MKRNMKYDCKPQSLIIKITFEKKISDISGDHLAWFLFENGRGKCYHKTRARLFKASFEVVRRGFVKSDSSHKINCNKIFAEKLLGAFALQKLLTFFRKNGSDCIRLKI